MAVFAGLIIYTYGIISVVLPDCTYEFASEPPDRTRYTSGNSGVSTTLDFRQKENPKWSESHWRLMSMPSCKATLAHYNNLKLI